MGNQVEELLRGLRQEEKRLADELELLNQQGEPIRTELQRVQDGIAGLLGEGAKVKKKNGKSGGGGGVTKDEVIKLIQLTLSTLPDLSSDIEALKLEVGNRLRASGRRLNGFPLRFTAAAKQLQLNGAPTQNGAHGTA